MEQHPEFEARYFEMDDAALRSALTKDKVHGVVAVGGDGTVKMVADHLASSGIPLGIVPTGSANGMAKELGIPTDIESAMQVIIAGKTRRIDVIMINGNEACIHLSDIGLNALLIKHFEEGSIRGQLGYARMVMKTLYSRKLIHVTIDNGVEQIRRKAFMIVLANARMYGTGASINPDGDPGDGVFEVVLLKQLSILELLKMMFRHRPFDKRKTEIIRARKVHIEMKKKMEFQIDGEYKGKVGRVDAEILPGALDVFT